MCEAAPLDWTSDGQATCDEMEGVRGVYGFDVCGDTRPLCAQEVSVPICAVDEALQVRSLLLWPDGPPPWCTRTDVSLCDGSAVADCCRSDGQAAVTSCVSELDCASPLGACLSRSCEAGACLYKAYGGDVECVLAGEIGHCDSGQCAVASSK